MSAAELATGGRPVAEAVAEDGAVIAVVETAAGVEFRVTVGTGAVTLERLAAVQLAAAVIDRLATPRGRTLP